MKPYSYDLRVRVFIYSLVNSIRKTANFFHISPNTVHLLIKLFIETGSLNPKTSKYEYPHLISSEGEMYLQLIISKQPDLTLEELCDHYYEVYQVRVSTATMCNTLKKMNITRKKITFSDPKKNTDKVRIKKQNYDEQLKKIEPEKRFYLDETGSCLNMSLFFGRSKRGQRAYDVKPTSPGETLNTVAILTLDGIKAEYMYSEPLTAPLFISYLDEYVLPILNDNQTLIMDNHPVHHAKIVEQYLNEHNIKFLFLPPYSPQLNPIEEAFSKIKQYIKKYRPRILDDLIIALNNAINSITKNDSFGYFNHAAQF
jgi:transposase